MDSPSFKGPENVFFCQSASEGSPPKDKLLVVSHYRFLYLCVVVVFMLFSLV